MNVSDEELFPAVSDAEDEPVERSFIRNPVAENLLKQMHDTTERVDKARSNVDHVKDLTEKILKKMHVRETCGVSSDSDNDSESYQATGSPVVKKKHTRRTAPSEILRVENTWQQVIDDKWIVGVVLKNTSDRILMDPRFYVIVEGQTETHEISMFWEIMDSLSTRTDQLAPEVDKLVATIVLDLPNFAINDLFKAHGTISYILDDKNLQTPIPPFRLRSRDVFDKNFAPKFTINMENTILAIKSISVDREFVISIDKEDSAARLLRFLEQKGFRSLGDESPDVYVARGNEIFHHCIFEIIAFDQTVAPVRISAKTPSQLELVVRLLRDDFPDGEVTDTENRTLEALRALEHELELEIAGDDPGALHRARVITDILIP